MEISRITCASVCERGEEVKSLCPLGVPKPGYVYTALKLVTRSEIHPSCV